MNVTWQNAKLFSIITFTGELKGRATSLATSPLLSLGPRFALSHQYQSNIELTREQWRTFDQSFIIRNGDEKIPKIFDVLISHITFLHFLDVLMVSLWRFFNFGILLSIYSSGSQSFYSCGTFSKCTHFWGTAYAAEK